MQDFVQSRIRMVGLQSCSFRHSAVDRRRCRIKRKTRFPRVRRRV